MGQNHRLGEQGLPTAQAALCGVERSRIFSVFCQHLLVPVVSAFVSCRRTLGSIVLDRAFAALPLLSEVGFELELFGERSWAIRAVPAVFGEVDPIGLLKTFLDELEDKKGRTVLDNIAR